MKSKRLDLTGQRFYKLVVREFSGKVSTSGNAIWLCDCDCGNTRLVIGSKLTCGNAKSCGCFLRTQFDCKIPACESKAVSNNLCNRHYKRSRGSFKTSHDIVERFALKTEVKSNGCIEWTGTRSSEGYGQTTVKQKRYGTHRLAWELENGPIEGGLFVCHKCDNPPCLNVDHLFLGTQQDNIRDAYAKGRMVMPWGNRVD